MQPKHIAWNDSYKEWEQDGGVRLVHAREAIAQPDDMETIDYENLLVRMFKKRVTAGKAHYTSHVVCAQRDETLTIQSAVKIYDDVLDDAQALKPVDLLAAFLEALGTPPVLLGGEAFRIVVMHSFRLSRPGTLELGVAQRPKPSIIETVSFLRLSEDKATMHVAHAWAIDFVTYREYLRQHT